MDSTFDALISEALEEAAAAGAGEHQIELLERASQEGEMTTEAAKSSVRNVMDCFAGFGGESKYEEILSPTGLVIPGYVVGFDEELGEQYIEQAIDACEMREHRWVNQVYQMQPSSRELVGRYVMSKEPILRECLERNGVMTDPEANGWDLAMLTLEQLEDPFVCLDEANINSL